MITRRLSALAALALALSGPAASLPGHAAPLRTHAAYAPLVERWESNMSLFDVPGYAVAVLSDGETWLDTGGIRNASGDPVTERTMFYIASITKTYLSTLTAQLAESGELSLDDPVREYLPRLELDGDGGTSITIRDLLAHRPGINSGEVVLLDAYTGEITEKRYYHWLSRVTPSGETTYTNVHYTLIGRVVTAVTGLDWRDALRERLLLPAGLSRTTGYASRMYDDPDAAIPLELDGPAWRPTAQRKTDRTMHAAGGLGTTIADAARYLRLHLEHGSIDGTRLFSEETATEIQREQSSFEPRGSLRIMSGFGLGWQRGVFNDRPFLAHGGGYTGTAAYLAFFPEEDAAFALLINAGGFARGWGDAVAIDVFETITGTEAEWKPWERFTERIAERKSETKADTLEAGGADTPHASTDAPELSRPVGLYTGNFHNAWLGTLQVTRVGDRLRLHLGDYEVAYESADVDELRLPELSDPPGRLRFVVGPGGRVDRILVADEDMGELAFER